jgi:uncharacterized protein YndB with AHSA1/START domain
MAAKPQHATIVLEQTYAAPPPERVVSEFADSMARARWSPPTGEALIYDQADFRAGGTDVFRCGPAGDLKFPGETRYLLIIPNEGVVSSETLYMAGPCLAVSLTTLDFGPAGDGTNLKITVQIVSFVGPGMIQGYEPGNQSALENLSRHLSDSVLSQS